MRKMVCKICGKSFQIISSRKGTAKYCSNKCRFISYKGKIAWNKGKAMPYRGMKNRYSDETLKKMSDARKDNPIKTFGNKHWNWKGGISILANRIRTCDKYRQWVIDIFERDNYTCRKCNTRGGDLEAHHSFKSFAQILKENNIRTLKDALNCSELWNMNYGITVCCKCHKIIDKYRN